VAGSKWVRLVAMVVCSIGVLGSGGSKRTQKQAPTDSSVWRTVGGQVILLPHQESLAELGLGLRAAQQTAVSRTFPKIDTAFALTSGPDSGLAFTSRGAGFGALLQGKLQSLGALLLTLRNGSSFTLGNLRFDFDPDGAWTATDTSNTGRVVFSLSSGMFQFDRASRKLEWAGLDVNLDPDWAAAAGIPEAGGALVATLFLEAQAAPAPELAELAAARGMDVPDAVCVDFPVAYGPDVIVGELTGTSSPSRLSNYGAVGGIRGYSVGTTSCNLGGEELDWISNTNQHPVIGQNLFRLKDGRFEQIGQSWLKHGFTALQGTTCCTNCQAWPNGTHLGVHCSDPYSSGLNGQQTGLGPKFEVNASTGVFAYPYTGQGQTGDAIYKHLQVHETDVDPTLNAGARYFVEGQYVTQDDAAANHQDNNSSYREVTAGAAPDFHLTFSGSTMRERAGIYGWKDSDPTVSITGFDMNDGHMDLGFKETNLGGGNWHYEFALFNMNSDLSVQSFSVPRPPGAIPANIGFHDVDYHSGEPFDGADWTATVTAASITWATQTFAQNQNANALRWGTLYNFRFDLNQRLTHFQVILEPFKPGGSAIRVTPGYGLATGTSTGAPSDRVRLLQPG